MAKKNYAYSNERFEGFGNLTQAPKKISGDNAKTTVVVLRVAVNSQNVDRDGDAIERVEYRDVKLFGRDAELAYANFEKGQRIHYAGDVYPVEYENRDGDLVEDYEVRAGRNDVYAAPLWESFDTDVDRDDEDEDEKPRRSSRKTATKKKSSAKRSRTKVEEDDAEDWDDEEDLEDEDLDDDFEEDTPPKRPQRSRGSRSRSGGSRSRSKSKSKASDVDVDEDADEYEELI